MLLLRKPMLCWGSLKSLRKRRMAEQENCFLLLWEITVICVSNVVLRGIRLEPRTCLSPQSRQACLMWLSHLKADSTCESVGLPKACCELRIHVSWTEFVLLVEEKSKPFISCICLCQAPCLVLIMRRVKVKRDLSARFKRCLPTPSIDTKPTLVWLPKFVDAVVGNKSRTVDGDNANRGRSLTWHPLVKPSTVTPSTYKSNRAWFLTWGRFLKKRTNRERFLTWDRPRMRSVAQNNLLILDGYSTNSWLKQDWNSAGMSTDMSTDILVNTKRSNFFLRVTHKYLCIKAKSYLFIPLFSTHTTLWVLRHIVQGHQRCGILNNDVIFTNLSIWEWHLYSVYGVSIGCPTSVNLIWIKTPCISYSWVCVLNSTVRVAVFGKQYEELFLFNLKLVIWSFDLFLKMW